MSFDHMIFGHKATSRDFFLAALWLSATVFVFLGLSLIVLNLDVELLVFAYLLIAAPAFLFLRPDLKAPVSGVVFKKFELLMLAVVALAAWIFMSLLWFRNMWAMIISIVLLGIIALILWLPAYAGRGTNPEEDERLRKLEAFSSADAFNITFVFIGLIFMLGFFRLVAMDLRQVFTLLIFLVILVKSISVSYYHRRGDVE